MNRLKTLKSPRGVEFVKTKTILPQTIVRAPKDRKPSHAPPDNSDPHGIKEEAETSSTATPPTTSETSESSEKTAVGASKFSPINFFSYQSRRYEEITRSFFKRFNRKAKYDGWHLF